MATVKSADRTLQILEAFAAADTKSAQAISRYPAARRWK